MLIRRRRCPGLTVGRSNRGHPVRHRGGGGGPIGGRDLRRADGRVAVMVMRAEDIGEQTLAQILAVSGGQQSGRSDADAEADRAAIERVADDARARRGLVAGQIVPTTGRCCSGLTMSSRSLNEKLPCDHIERPSPDDWGPDDWAAGCALGAVRAAVAATSDTASSS